MARYSRTALIICTVFIFLTGFFYYPRWKQPGTEATISWDVSGYYFYLPAAFIYKDLKQCRFADTILKKYRPTPDFQQAFQPASGYYVMKYTMGQAIMFAPWFLSAHLVAVLSGYPADGFSMPYQFGIGIGMLIYAFIGLWFLRKILLRFFDDGPVAVTMLTIVFATNYLNYTAIDGAMTHNSLFMLYCIFLYSSIRYFDSGKLQWNILLGLLAGLLVLVRPTEIICISIPILWNVYGIDRLKQRIRSFTQQPFAWMPACFTFFAVVAFQLIYWKWSSGSWVVDGYRGEGFSWLHPHIAQGLFSYKGGWFTYTPVMLLTIPGLFFLYRKYKNLFIPVFVFSVLFLYICFSWKEWWYGSSLGQRAIIQAYPVFSFALTAGFDLFRKSRVAIFLVSLFLFVCGLYNLWLTHQAHRGQLFKAGEMTGAYFWKVIGRFHVPNNTLALLDNGEQLSEKLVQHAYSISFTPEWMPDTLDRVHQYSNTCLLNIPVKTEWVRVRIRVTTPIKEWDTWKMPQAIIAFYHHDSIVKSNFVRISRMLSDGETGDIDIDASVPQVYDRVRFSVWNAGTEKIIYLQSVKVSGFRR